MGLGEKRYGASNLSFGILKLEIVFQSGGNSSTIFEVYSICHARMTFNVAPIPGGSNAMLPFREAVGHGFASRNTKLVRH